MNKMVDRITVHDATRLSLDLDLDVTILSCEVNLYLNMPSLWKMSQYHISHIDIA